MPSLSLCWIKERTRRVLGTIFPVERDVEHRLDRGTEDDDLLDPTTGSSPPALRTTAVGDSVQSIFARLTFILVKFRQQG